MDITLFSVWEIVLANLAIIDIGLKILALIIIPNNRKPSTATAWLLAIFFIPLVGLPLFIIFGKSDLSKPRKIKQDEMTAKMRNIYKQQTAIISDNQDFNSIADLNTNLSGLPVVDAKKFQIIDDYQGFFEQAVNYIKKAKKQIWFEFYITSYDPTTEELMAELSLAVKRGVEVKMLYDHFGSWMYPGYKDFINFCKQNGIEQRKMLPIKPFSNRYFDRPDLRNHRKMLIIDSKIAFVGSQNIIDSSYNKQKNIRRGLRWKELMVKLEGNIVQQLELIFFNDWYAETGQLLLQSLPKIGLTKANKNSLLAQILPSGPGYSTDNNLRLFNSLLYAAKEQIIITSPYFVPDESMYIAITTAAKRGIKVVLFVSEIKDQFLVYHAQRSYYEGLMKAGVEIYMYKKPFVLHAKHVTIDSAIAVIGSSNMDIRSFELNLEISVLINSKKLVKQLRTVEAKYMKNSKKLKLNAWLSRPYYVKVIDNLARLTSGLQ